MHKVINLQAQNIKRIKAIDITPKADVVKIKGRNGQGKSTTLDCILWALEGARNVQKMPIRNGEEKGTIRLDLGDMIIERTFWRTEDGGYDTRLKAETKQGYLVRQDAITRLTNRLSFDPLEFTRMKPREQYELLAGFVEGVDLDKFEADQKADFEERTVVNRRAAEAETGAQMIVLSDDPGEGVDEQAIAREMQHAGEQNVAAVRAKQKLIDEPLAYAKDQEARATSEEDELAELLGNIEDLRARIKSRREAVERLRKDAAEAVVAQPIDTAEIAAKLAQASAHNRAVAAYRQAAKRKAELATAALEHNKRSTELTQRREARAKTVQDAITAATLPVDGLGFGAGYVTFDGLPLEQASDAERLRISAAIAMRQNADLRVMRIREGSLLDAESMQLLTDMAREHNYQVWIEIVGEEGDGFIIEDGTVRAAGAEPTS